MNKFDLKNLVKQCIVEVLQEDEPLYVEYIKPMANEEPFTALGENWQFVWAKYPNGKEDIGVYRFHGDVVISYKVFQHWLGKNV